MSTGFTSPAKTIRREAVRKRLRSIPLGGLYALAKQRRESRDFKAGVDRPPKETTEGGLSAQNVD